MTGTVSSPDQNDHINPLIREITVGDGAAVPILPKWIPPWAQAFGNGKIPVTKMTLVEPRLAASEAGYLVPEVAARWVALQGAATAAGYTLTMTGAYRTYAQQLELFGERYSLDNTGNEPRTFEGKTYWLKPGVAMVASPGTSNHGWGCAIDMALSVGSKLEAVSEQFVQWAAGVAVGLGFSWEDSEPWHIHAIALNDSMPTVSAPTAGSTASVATAPLRVPQPPMQLGSSGPEVAALQTLCADQHWGDPGRPDGHFGPRTAEAVKAMQAAVGASPDGAYGARTAARLAAHLGLPVPR